MISYCKNIRWFSSLKFDQKSKMTTTSTELSLTHRNYILTTSSRKPYNVHQIMHKHSNTRIDFYQTCNFGGVHLKSITVTMETSSQKPYHTFKPIRPQMMLGSTNLYLTYDFDARWLSQLMTNFSFWVYGILVMWAGTGPWEPQVMYDLVTDKIWSITRFNFL